MSYSFRIHARTKCEDSALGANSKETLVYFVCGATLPPMHSAQFTTAWNEHGVMAGQTGELESLAWHLF